MKRLLIVCALLLVLPCVTFAVDFPVPDTGQTGDYTATFGEDSDYTTNPHSYTQLDASGNEMSFSDDYSTTPWAMVRDNVTGLIWEVKTDDGSIHDRDNFYTWYDSNPATNGGDAGTPGDGTDTEDFVNALNAANFGGFNDWRMPTVKELSFIVHSNITTGPTIDQSYFPNTVSSKYWSATTKNNSTAYAWYVDFNNGYVIPNIKSYYYYYVRAVRGGQSGSFGNFFDNGDGTVTDNDTGLMWQQATAPGSYSWESALSYCEGLSLAGHDDWRLPDRNELQSIVDYSTYSHAIDTTYFPDTMFSDYWSSTTETNLTGFARSADFEYGFVDSGNKFFGNYVRAVRGGQCGSFGDSDGDTVCNDDDNCSDHYNPFQEDTDGNGLGDACDECTDIDDDGYGNPGFPNNTCEQDNCPDISNPGQEDDDSDEVGNVCDNCLDIYNSDQTNSDNDSYGNVCDNCPDVDNEDQADSDGDTVGDACDNCPATSNPNQADSNDDGVGDVCSAVNIGDQWANCGDVGVKIPICLVNLYDEVGAVQVDLCENINDCLICVGCEMTERTTIFDCMVNELENGCCAVVVFSKNPGGVINPGECDIVIIDYTLKDEPQCCNSCIEINAVNIEVVDQYGYLVDTGVGNVGMVCPFECGDVEPAASTATSWDCGDGDVDIFDILEEVDFIIHVKDPDDCQAVRADVPTGTPPNCDPYDGAIDVGDLMVIIDMALNRQDCCSYYYGGVIY